MREALGQPLQNISRELLNKVVSKEVARDLRKYKYNVLSQGKTPSKENRRGGTLSAEKNGTLGGVGSPNAQGRRLNFGSPSAPADDSKSPHLGKLSKV
jgi:hypothetical protein